MTDLIARRGFVMTGLIAGFTLATARGHADPIHTDAAGLIVGETRIPVEGGELPAYFSRPEGGGPCPVVLVIEEVFGVHEYIRDICRRLAKRGYLAVATEYYARLADLSKMTDSAEIVSTVISRAPDAQMMADMDATVAWAGGEQGDVKRLGIIGFCRGGRQAWLYAAHNPKLRAAVAFYGPLDGPTSDIQPYTARDVAGEIQCPLLALYGGQDITIPEGSIRAAQAAAQKAGKIVTVVIYPDAGHGFHADYRPSYRQADAEDGWRRALDWFRQHGVA